MFSRRHPPFLKLSTLLADLIADSVKLSSHAHVFHFYSLLRDRICPRKALTACLGGRPGCIIWCVGREGEGVSFNARELVREYLKEVGLDLGVPR